MRLGFDENLVPFYTVRLKNDGREKSTVAERLRPLAVPDQVPSPIKNSPFRGPGAVLKSSGDRPVLAHVGLAPTNRIIAHPRALEGLPFTVAHALITRSLPFT